MSKTVLSLSVSEPCRHKCLRTTSPRGCTAGRRILQGPSNQKSLLPLQASRIITPKDQPLRASARASHANGARRHSGARESRVGESEGGAPRLRQGASVPTRRTWLSRVVGITLLLGAAVFPHAGPSPALAQASVAFDRDIRPILEGKCVSCHGGALQLSKLDLRTRETALSGGARGAVLVPGNAERSRLYRMVAGLEQPAMPMQGTPLDPAQLALLKQWIDEGARWDGAVNAPSATGNAAVAAVESRPLTPEERAYWAFKLPVQAPVPQVDRKEFTTPDRSVPGKGARASTS